MTGLVVFIALVAAIVVFAAASRAWKVAIIYPPSVGLLYRDGRFERELSPGRYGRFDLFGRTRIFQFSLAEIPTQLGEVTVLSKDQFSFRLALAPIVKIVDARAYHESQPTMELHAFSPLMATYASHASLHPLLAATAGEVVGTKTLSEIFADQASMTAEVQAKLELAIPGAVIEKVLLTSINLPPETRRMFTEVERARLEAKASLERARGEHASLRVLANAARLAADNPALANLRMLQAIENSKGNTTVIVGTPGAPGIGLPLPAIEPSNGR